MGTEHYRRRGGQTSPGLHRTFPGLKTKSLAREPPQSQANGGGWSP